MDAPGRGSAGAVPGADAPDEALAGGEGGAGVGDEGGLGGGDFSGVPDVGFALVERPGGGGDLNLPGALAEALREWGEAPAQARLSDVDAHGVFEVLDAEGFRAEAGCRLGGGGDGDEGESEKQLHGENSGRYLNRSGANSLRWRRQVCHSCEVPWAA